MRRDHVPRAGAAAGQTWGTEVKIHKALLRAAATTIAAVLAAGGLSACGEDAVELPDPAPPPTTVAPLPTPDLDLTPEEQEAVAAVQAVFETFTTNYQQVLVDGEPALNTNFGQLEPLGGYLPDITWDELEDNHAQGRRGEGALSWSLVDVEVDLDNIITAGGEDLHIPLVRLQYCLDATEWRYVDKDSGQPTDPGPHRLLAEPGQRHLATTEFIYYDPIPDGEEPVWWFAKWENQEDQPC